MPTPFLSSEEYDERAHQLYNEGQYDEALEVLREGLTLYPTSVELHIGVGYARLAREEFAWARRSFEEALVLEPDHEDALAGLGETLLKFGQHQIAVRHFQRILDLGYADDIDLVLQSGRTLFREHDPKRAPLMEEARRFFEVAVKEAPESAEAHACLGYALHRSGDDAGAIASLRRALQLDEDHAEARIYLANVLYDRQEFEPALHHLSRTTPDDHWDDLGIARYVELRKALHGVAEDDESFKMWEDRIHELGGDLDEIDEMLADIETRFSEGESGRDPRSQLELFGVMLADLADQRRDPQPHRIRTPDGREYQGTWEEIVSGMRDADPAQAGRPLQEYMRSEAERRGMRIPSPGAEEFIRASASAGLLTIVL